jgi:hypothetical protein
VEERWRRGAEGERSKGAAAQAGKRPTGSGVAGWDGEGEARRAERPQGAAAVGLGGDLGVGWMRMALWQHYIHRVWMVERYIRAAIGPIH